MNLKKLLVIVGPTASGKSELAVRLAKKHKGEIISVDSRQIYRGLDIGTGKVEGKWQGKNYLYKGVRHHLIDFANPKKQFSAAQFQKLARRVINDIYKRGKLPILCGGTMHWVDAIVYDQKFPKVKPNKRLRDQLEKKTTKQLFTQLKKLDPNRAKTIDAQNPRRLIRALEIILSTGKPVPELHHESKYDVEWVGIKLPQTTLNKNIEKRFKQWLKQGLLTEIENLHKQGLSWQRIEQFGLEYKFVSQYLQGNITHQEMLNQSVQSIKHYAKRQMTWWKRNKEIKWQKKKPA